VLFIAGLCEVGWAVGLKYTEGFSRLGPSQQRWWPWP
jgi:quaternary ammonium compound-resistance protein SugE